MKNPSSEEEMGEKLSELLHLQEMFFPWVISDKGVRVILMNYPDEDEFQLKN